MRRTKRIIASLVAAVTVISQVMPMMKVTAATDNVRLATFNIEANMKTDVVKLNELLKRNNVDIVGLQEVDINTSRNPYNMLEKFVEQGDYAYSSFQKAIETGGGDYGVALLSNLELINTNGGALNSEGIKEARAWQKGEIEVNGKVIAVYNTHLTYESVEARAKQLLELKATMDQDPAEYKVAFGDFNVDQNHNEIYPFLEDYNIANGKGGKWYDTFNGTDASMKTSAVDNIITSRNLEISNITMVETDLSDHNLFYADAKLLDQPVASRDYLDLVISDANALDEGKYSNASYNTLDEKLVAGELLDQNATQEQINKAVKDIQTAQDNLKTRYPNLALNKDVNYSGVEGDKNNNGEWVYPQFAGEKAIDGDAESRWSAAKQDEQWLIVDLGRVESIEHIILNFSSEAPEYSILVSKTGEEDSYQEIFSTVDGSQGNEIVKSIGFEKCEARYVKYVQHKMWKYDKNGKYYGSSIYEFEVYEQDPDAKDYSNIALNQPVSASSLEVGDGRFTAPMAVDGVVSEDSRVSFGKTADNQWLLVDLGSRKTVSEFVINYESCPPAFKIQVSTDGVNYQDVYEAADLPDGGPSEIKEIQIEATKARYVKYVQLKRWIHTNKNKYSGSIYEFEVYKERDHTVTTADEVLKSLNKEAPQINGNKIVLPAVPDGFEISLYGCDNKQVVAMDGTITRPLEDMDINVLYQVKNLNDETDIAYSEADINFIVPGAYNKEESINAKPNVMPGLREWKGNEGEFVLSKNPRIVIDSNDNEKTANTVKSFLKDMLGIEATVEKGKPQIGDIYLQTGSSEIELGQEGYYMEVADYVKITAPTQKGLLYGGISVTQILYQDTNKNTIPKGIARDYPKYEVRSGMFDVGREFIDMDYLTEITKYMAWFKMSEVHIHINDVMDNKDSAFRLESDIPGLNEGHRYYTKEEYRNYQQVARDYGVKVITEFDTPAHSAVFAKVLPDDYMYDWKHLDIRKQEVYDFIEDLLDEYLDGDNPVITSDTFHIGTDEYNKSYSEEMRKYTDHFIKYVNNKGYKTRVWGSLGKNGFNGTTPVTNEATVNLWAPYWADVKETFDAGYDVINTVGGHLYIVPGEDHNPNKYSDYLDIENLYNNWDVNNFKHQRSNYLGTAIMQVAHPQTKGAEFALWNDYGGYESGITKYDMMIRAKDAIALVSEKTWFGEKSDNQTADEFLERVDSVNNYAPGANPRRYVESKTDVITSYDFENNLKDDSRNNYNATSQGTKFTEGKDGLGIGFDGNSYMSLPIKSVGFPYTVSFDIKPDGVMEPGTVLFEGKDGILYGALENGNIGYTREGQTYHYGTALETDKWSNITIVCDKKDTTLYIDGKKVSVASNIKKVSRNSSTTFVLPVEKIGNGFKGTIDNLTIYNRDLNAKEIADKNDATLSVIRENVALNKEASASSYYADHQKAEKAFDGIINQDAATAEQSRWASERTHDQWIQVDLNKVYKVDQIKITWEDAYGVDYELKGSVNGKDWFTIKNVTGNVAKENNHTGLGDIEARYIKLIGTKAANNAKYGYSIYEIEVYENPKNDLLRTISQVKDKLSEMNVGNFHGQIKEEAYQTFTAYLTNLENEVVGKESISEEEMLKFKEELSKKYTNLKKQVVRVDKSALETVLEVAESKLAEGYSEANSTVSSWQSFIQNKKAAEAMADRMDITQSDVDKMVSELQTALDNLTFRALESSFNELVALIDEVTKMETDYSAEMFKVMKGYLDQANALVALGAGEVVEKDVQANLTNLANEKAILISYWELKVSVEVAKEILDKEAVNLRPATLKVLQDAYEAGRKLIDDNSKELIVLQNAKQEINEAIEGLLEIVERKDLDKLIEQVKDLKEEDYTEESWKTFKNGYERAVTVNQDLDANEGAIQNAYDELLRAFNELKQVVNKDNLLLQIELAKQVLANKDKYDIELVKELEELLSQAVALIDNDVSSEDVNKMSDALLTKIEAVKASQKEEPKVEEQPGTEVSDKTKKNAKTGDETMLFEFAMISLVALLAVVRLRKKS